MPAVQTQRGGCLSAINLDDGSTLPIMLLGLELQIRIPHDVEKLLQHWPVKHLALHLRDEPGRTAIPAISAVSAMLGLIHVFCRSSSTESRWLGKLTCDAAAKRLWCKRALDLRTKRYKDRPENDETMEHRMGWSSTLWIMNDIHQWYSKINMNVAV